MSAIALINEMKNQPLVGYSPALAALTYADLAEIANAAQGSTEVRVPFDQVKTLLEASMAAAPEQRSALLKEVVDLFAAGYEQTSEQGLPARRLAYSCYAAVIAFLAGDVQSCKKWLYSAKDENDALAQQVRNLIPEYKNYDNVKSNEGDVNIGGIGIVIGFFVAAVNPVGGLAIVLPSLGFLVKGVVGTKLEDAKGDRRTEASIAVRPLLEECKRTKLVLEAAIEKF
jgi:hypothetical protein